MFRDDTIRLRHMLDAAQEASEFAQGHTRNDLNSDRKLVLALVKDVEIIGEAAYQISLATRGRLPDIPWEDIISMRHRLVSRGSQVKIPAEVLARYDDNLRAHLAAISRGCSEPITLRYFQYLAALYNEIVLDRLFSRAVLGAAKPPHLEHRLFPMTDPGDLQRPERIYDEE
jgi:uncharacterized protein with HEPN domain